MVHDFRPIGATQAKGGVISVTQLPSGIAAIHFTFPSNEFSAVLAILTERFGPPTRQETREARTMGGGVFTNVVNSWDGRETYVTLTQRMSRVDEGSLAIGTHAYLEHLTRQLAETRQKGVKDF